MGERIAQLRRRRGLSQTKLANALGVTIDYLLIGRSRKSPTMNNTHAHLIATILRTVWHVGK